MDLIELTTASGSSLTIRAEDVRGIESHGEGCLVQWVVGDVVAKIECRTAYDMACKLWWGV